MSATIELTAQRREDVGKGASRRLRRMQDKVPAIVYGGGQEPLSLTFLHKDILKVQKNEAFYSQILTVHVDGKPNKVLLKDVQRHPYKPVVMHLDFQRITGKETLHVRVPLHFLNEENAPALKQGGIISHLLKDIEVITSPASLPEHIDVDLANLELNQIIHISDLRLPAGVTSVELSHGAEHDQPVATAHLPRAALEVEEEVSAEEEETPEAESEPEAPEQGE
jgi:large subunit ribosomal protein L25